jgi:hypothetical protein
MDDAVDGGPVVAGRVAVRVGSGDQLERLPQVEPDLGVVGRRERAFEVESDRTWSERGGVVGCHTRDTDQ